MVNEGQQVKLHEQSERLDFWQALNGAALAVQQSTHSETAVYEAFAAQLVKLGIYGAISMLDETAALLTITAVVLSEEQQKEIEKLRELVGFWPLGHQYKVDTVLAMQRTIETAAAYFVPDNNEIIRSVLMPFVPPALGEFMEEFGSLPAILTPVLQEAQVVGVMYFSSPFLTSADMPAISAFSHHLSIALENARLFQSLQIETESLRRREEQFRILAENVPGVIYLCHNNQTFDMIYLNDGVEMLTGYAKEKFLSGEISFRNLYHPDDSDFIQPEKENRGDDAATYHHVYRIRHRAGSWRWVEEFGKSVYDDDGRMLFLEGSITDITERRQAEILQSTLYRIATVANADLTLEQMYPALHSILGDLMEVQNFYIALVAEASDLLTLPYFVDEMDERSGQPFDAKGGLTDYVIRSGQPQLLSRLDIKQLLQKGRLQPLGSMPEIWLGVPLRTKAQVFGAVVVQSYRDASVYTEREKQLLFFVSGQISAALERKRAEEQLRKMAEEIKNQSRIFEEILSNTPDQFLVFDREGVIIFASSIMSQILGIPPEQILGKTLEALNFLPKEVMELTKVEREMVLQSGQSLSGEVIVPNREGGFRDVEYILSPIKGDDGQVTSIVSAARDITERNKTKAALHHAQKLESLGILAGGVAHDFNNLLVGMMAQNSLAQAKLPPHSPVLPHLSKAEAATERAAVLTRQLLAYSGQGQFTIQPLNLNALIRENANLYHAAVSAHISLKYDLEVDLPEIEGDPAQMQQLLMNLVVNSHEAIASEPGTITVRTRMKTITAVELPEWNVIYNSLSAGSYVCLEVADDGQGMEQEIVSRIFEPFFTTKFTGRGLGLAAVSGIILGHKGGLKVTSKQNSGTRFQIIFTAIAAKRATAVTPSEEPTGNAEFILVIDDELPVREAVADILALEGLATLTAVDGQSGIDLYKERWSEIKLVLLDLSLPDIRGKEVLAQLKAFNPQVQVILSSGYSEGEALQGLENSGVHFLQKPYTISTLLQLVNEGL